MTPKMDVRFRVVTGIPNVKGFCSVVIDDWLKLDNLKLASGKNGLYISPPAEKKKNGEYEDHYFPITKEGRDWLQEAVIAAWKKEAAALSAAISEA